MHSELSCYQPTQTCECKTLYVSLMVTAEPVSSSAILESFRPFPVECGATGVCGCSPYCAEDVPSTPALLGVCTAKGNWPFSSWEGHSHLLPRRCDPDTPCVPDCGVRVGEHRPPQPPPAQGGSRGAFVHLCTRLCLPTPRGIVQHRKPETDPDVTTGQHFQWTLAISGQSVFRFPFSLCLHYSFADLLLFWQQRKSHLFIFSPSFLLFCM